MRTDVETDLIIQQGLSNNNTIGVAIEFGDYPEEISWTVLDSTGTTVFHSDPEAIGETHGRPLVQYVHNLPAGNYSLMLHDSYGDGMDDGIIQVNLYLNDTKGTQSK